MRLVLLSDLHIGMHRADLVQPLLDSIAAAKADHIIVAGDLVQRARKPLFAQAKALHDELEAAFNAFALALTAPGLAADAPAAQSRLGKGYLEPAALPDLGFILALYDRLEPDEMEQAIFENRLFILRDGGGPFAFIGLHDDFSMGMLFILPEYRRKGWAERLERALTARVLEMGELPYGHVFIDNENSLRLQEKLGFTRCSDTVFWMWKGE